MAVGLSVTNVSPAKRLNRSICRLRHESGWAPGSMFARLHIGATWRIRLNCPCAVAIRPLSNYSNHLLQSPAIAIANSVIFWSCYFIFFPPPIYRHPWADFCETLPHDVVCSEILYLPYGCSYVPPKKFEGRKTQFLAIFGPKIDTLSPAIAWKIGKSKTIVSICGYVFIFFQSFAWKNPHLIGVPAPPHPGRTSPPAVLLIVGA